MLEKCWFVLKSPFPAPTLPANGIGRARGPCCPGNLVPSLHDLNFVINSPPGPTEYPPDAPLWSLGKTDFSWKKSGENSRSFGNKVVTPLNGIGAEVSVQFHKTVSEYWKFDRLETFELQLSPVYLHDSLESPSVVRYINSHKSPVGLWSMFMITGIMVAHGATSESSRSREFALTGEAQIESPAITGVGGNIDLRNESRTGENLYYRQKDPFVWAVKLSKITKGIVDRKWTSRSFTKGALFGLGGARESEEEILEQLAEEGFENVEVFGLSNSDGALVVWKNAGLPRS